LDVGKAAAKGKYEYKLKEELKKIIDVITKGIVPNKYSHDMPQINP
jgi:hypothetical protein